MTTQPHVRPATDADIPGILPVLAETWRDTYGPFVSLEAIDRRPEVVEIARLYVLPSAQRRGIGGRLLAAAVAAFPGQPRARLEVEAQNPKGRAFDRKQGFVEVGERTIEALGIHLRLIAMERGGGGAEP